MANQKTWSCSLQVCICTTVEAARFCLHNPSDEAQEAWLGVGLECAPENHSFNKDGFCVRCAAHRDELDEKE